MKLLVAAGLLVLAIQVFAEEENSGQDALAVSKRRIPRGVPGFHLIGCFADRRQRRAIHYLGRAFGVHRLLHCANMARIRGFKVFALQGGTFCMSDARAHITYKMYGRSNRCRGLTGGHWANDVYQFSSLPYLAVGCFRDRHPRAMGKRLNRRNVNIQGCARLAKARHFRAFGMQAISQCYSGPNAHRTFAKYGHIRNCVNGVGRASTNYVYRFTHPLKIPAYRFKGCWADRHHRAIRFLGLVFGGNRARECAYLASKRGFRVFALQHGIHCFADATAHLTYARYGRSRKCRNWVGGVWANDVWEFNNPPYVAVGCFNDRHVRALPHYLGFRRGDIQWCYRRAKAHGYKMFAVQNLGHCFSGPTSQATYKRYGHSNRCRNGLGAVWANSVYSINGPAKPGRKFKKINRRPVCFLAKGNRPGVFRYYGPNRPVNGLLLVYRSGHITCHVENGHTWSRWGCGTTHLNVLVTDQYNYLIYPRKEYIDNHNGLWYHLPGKHSKFSKSLMFSNVASPFYLTSGMPLKIWYGEDLKNWHDHNNAGHVCVDVYLWSA